MGIFHQLRFTFRAPPHEAAHRFTNYHGVAPVSDSLSESVGAYTSAQKYLTMKCVMPERLCDCLFPGSRLYCG